VLPNCGLFWWDRLPRTLGEAHTCAVDAVFQAGLCTDLLEDYREKLDNEARDSLANYFASTMFQIFDANVRLSRYLHSLGHEFTAVAIGIERFEGAIAPNVHALVHYVTFEMFGQALNAVIHTEVPRDQQSWGEITAEDPAWEESPPLREIKKHEIAKHIDVVEAAWAGQSIISWDHVGELWIRLEQEVCRAYDRRLITGRVCAYPEDREEENDAGTEAAKWDGATEARNKWLYGQCRDLVPYASIVFGLKEKAEWDPIESFSGIKRAANAYAARKGLPAIPRRQRGRRGKEGKSERM